MNVISQILHGLFKGEDPKHPVPEEEPPVHEEPEKDTYQGGEFLDDRIRTDDIEEDEIY